MKFGKRLDEASIPAWRDKYVRYKRHKKTINGADAARASSSDPALVRSALEAVSAAFLRDLQTDLDTLNSFVAAERRSQTAEAALLVDARNQLRTLQAAGEGASADAQQARALIGARGRALWQAQRQLHEFAELNYEAVYKATKKHDKYVGIPRASRVLLLVDAQPFMELLHADGGAGGDVSASGSSREGSSGEEDALQASQKTALNGGGGSGGSPPSLLALLAAGGGGGGERGVACRRGSAAGSHGTFRACAAARFLGRVWRWRK